MRDSRREFERAVRLLPSSRIFGCCFGQERKMMVAGFESAEFLLCPGISLFPGVPLIFSWQLERTKTRTGKTVRHTSVHAFSSILLPQKLCHIIHQNRGTQAPTSGSSSKSSTLAESHSESSYRACTTKVSAWPPRKARAGWGPDVPTPVLQYFLVSPFLRPADDVAKGWVRFCDEYPTIGPAALPQKPADLGRCGTKLLWCLTRF